MAIPGNLLSAATESIEPNVSGWRARLNCTLSLGSNGRNGPHVLAVKATAAGEMQAETVSTYPLVPGEVYYTFADAASASTPERIGIEWLDASNTPMGAVTWSLTTASASSSLHRVSVAGVCPAEASRARVVLSSTETAAGALHFWENAYLGFPIRTTGNLLDFNTESGGELDISGWTTDANASLSRQAPAAVWPVDWLLSGGEVMAITAQANGTTSLVTAQRSTAEPGRDYLAYVYLNPPTTGAVCWVELRFYGSSGTQLRAVRAKLAQTTVGWYRQVVSGISPQGTASCAVAAGMDGASAGQVLRIEGAVVRVAPPLATGTVIPYEDASFEQGTGSWAVASGPATIARSTPWGAQAYDRSYALTVTTATAATSVIRSAPYPIVPGVNWRLAIRAKSTAGAWSLDDALRWYDTAGNELGLSGNLGATELPSDGQWWTLYDDRLAPTGAAAARIEWKLIATATNSVLQLDAVTLRQVLPLVEATAHDDQAYITLILRELFEGELLTIWRVGQNGRRTLVRGPNGLIERQQLDSDLMVIEDYEASLGVPVSYYVEMYAAGSLELTGHRDSDTVQLDPGDGDFAWLKDPGAAHRNLRVRVRQAPDFTRPIQQSAYRVRGRRNAVIHADVRSGLEGELVIWTENDEQRTALHWLLDPGHVLLWQAAPGYGIDDTYVTIGEVTEARFSPDARHPWRAWTLPLTQVDMPVTGAGGSAGRTWQDVLSENDTWEQVLGRYETWEDILFGQRIEA